MASFTCPTCQTLLPADALFCASCGTPVGATPATGISDADLPVRDRLARALGPKFAVRGTLGKGGFAEVYEVFDNDLHRRLAVKVLHPEIAWTSGMIARFKQEARTLARLDHPNILPIHFVGEGEGLVYYAMPLVEGETVKELLRSRPSLDVDQALLIIRSVLEALDHAHALGLVHRDIKPENILIQRSNGRVLLVDFGIAKQVGDAAGGLTATGFTLGTPHYMAPEQALGQGDLDHRADLYATGAVLYQMLTGAPPYEGDSSQEIVGKHIAEPVPRPSLKNARIPSWLSDVIVRLLAKRPDERYQSAAAVLEALSVGRASGRQSAVSAGEVARRIQGEEKTTVIPSQERPVASLDTTPTPTQRRSLGLPIVLLLVAIGVAAFMLLRGGSTLTVVNQLVEPIRVVLGDSTAEIPPGQERKLELSRKGKNAFIQWYMVQPMGPSGLPLGEPMQGTLRPEKAGRVLRLTVTSRTADGTFFTPLVTNGTDRSLRVVVNAGLKGTMDCGCGVPAGASRTRIGYYRL
ncbi:MAG: serine/threonine-protein kinase, partial [Gemmatimonadota bacterium]